MSKPTPISRWLAMTLAVLLCAGAVPSQAADAVTVDAELATPMLLAGRTNTAYLRVAVTGADSRAVRSRAPVNVAIVLDQSGSMQGEKIAEARRAAIMAIDRLHDTDIVSVVTYQSTVNVLVPATRASDRDSIRRAIEGITAGGSTALFAGVSKGAAEVRKFLNQSHVNRVILLSDGLANVGPSSPADLGDLGASLAKEGVSVTTIGLGLQYNEDLMTLLAYKSDGNHFFVENARDLEVAYASEFGDVLSVVAQNVAVEIAFPQGVRPVRTLGRAASIDGQTLQASFNHVYGEQTKYLLVELELPLGRTGQVLPIGSIDASFTNLADGGRRKVHRESSVTFTDSPALVEERTRPGIMVEVVRQLGAERNELAVALRDAGKINEARQVLQSNQSFLEQNAARFDDSQLKLDATFQGAALNSLEAEDEWGRARKEQRAYQFSTKQQQAVDDEADPEKKD